MLNDPYSPYPKSRSEKPRRKLASRALIASNSIILECPIDRSLRVDAIVVCNIASTQVTFRLWHTLPVESATQATALFYDMIVRPNSTLILELPMHMNSGDRIIAYASAASSLGISLFGEDQ